MISNKIKLNQTIFNLLLSLILFGIYTNLGINLGGKFIPGIVTVVSIFILMFWLLKINQLKVLTSALSIFFVGLVNVISTSHVTVNFIERFFSVALLTTSIVGFAIDKMPTFFWSHVHDIAVFFFVD